MSVQKSWRDNPVNLLKFYTQRLGVNRGLRYGNVSIERYPDGINTKNHYLLIIDGLPPIKCVKIKTLINKIEENKDVFKFRDDKLNVYDIEIQEQPSIFGAPEEVYSPRSSGKVAGEVNNRNPFFGFRMFSKND